MGHRHQFTTSHVFESENEQNWNHMNTEQPFGHLGWEGTGENSSFFYPVENMCIDGMPFASNWNPAPRSYGYSSMNHNVDAPHFQPDASGPSHDPFQHPISAGTFGMASGNYAHHAPSSSYDQCTFLGVEGGFVDLTMSNGRGPHKRKSPVIPSVSERGSTSRHYSAGSSSSELPRSAELQHEKVNMDTSHMPWDHVSMIPSYRGNGLSIRGDGSMRNVRSRSEHDLESNLARTHLSSNPLHTSYPTSLPIDHSSTINLAGQGSTGLTNEWNHISVAPHGRVMAPDTSGFGHDPNHFLLGSTGNASVDNGLYHHDFMSSRSTAVPQSYPGALAQTVRGVRSTYSQRSPPAFRASSSNLQLGHAAHSDEGLQPMPENYPRHPRPVASVGWRHNDRSGRLRMSNNRYRVPEESALQDRFSSEVHRSVRTDGINIVESDPCDSGGFMAVDRPAFHGSRNVLDHHRDMRLDIDNMSYEELLSLSERIGNVSTGLSEDLIPKCLTETIYCSSDQIQDEGSCAICLEEYNDRDDVGALKSCGHDYHVSCIKKWLSMKNSCPICKGCALPDNMKDK